MGRARRLGAGWASALGAAVRRCTLGGCAPVRSGRLSAGALGAPVGRAARGGCLPVRSGQLSAERSVSRPPAVIAGMTLVIAHIGGIPVEETVAGFAPVVAVAGGCCIATLRARWRRVRGLDPEG